MCTGPVSQWHYNVIRKAFAVAVHRAIPRLKLRPSQVSIDTKHWDGELLFKASAPNGRRGRLTGTVQVEWVEDWDWWCRVSIDGHDIPLTGNVPKEQPGDVLRVSTEYELMMGREPAGV